MKRSFFISRRLHRSIRPRRFASRFRTRKHPHYHHSVSRRTHKNKRRRSVKRGGAIGETVATVEGVPVGEHVVMTNSKGITRTLVRHDPLQNAETAGVKGDDDV